MAFLNKLRGLPMPPIKNVLNVAMQTARQTMPDKSKQSEYADPSMAGGGGPTGPPIPPRPQSVRFADQEGAGAGGGGGGGYRNETHELNPFGNPNAYSADGEYGGMATTQFTGGEYDGSGGEGNGYQQQGGGGVPGQRRQDSVASTDSSFVGGEGGTERINEFQAAWNVTNAIQGMFIVSLPFAVLRGGYWAIIAMVGIAYICCYTGKVSVCGRAAVYQQIAH